MSVLHVGLDIGSTTAKVAVLDGEDRLLYSRYCRHFADIPAAVDGLIAEVRGNYRGKDITLALAGSGAISLAEGIEIPFTQELVACATSIGRYLPQVDVAIELGGEDAKLTFFDPGGVDQRMNETCAGGTGAFLDQMAVLLDTDAAGLNELAKSCRTLYPIASRCGVFAKTDVQPLIRDGAAREDIAGSIFQAVVNQTIGGLACGRRIAGNVAFLGGPLYFLSELRARFAATLNLRPEQCVFPENPHLFVAIGAALLGKKGDILNMEELHEKAVRYFSSRHAGESNVLPALFADDQAREEFKKRHSRQRIRSVDLTDYAGDAFLGIDVGSTTSKIVLIGEGGELLFSRYVTGGDPLGVVKSVLSELYDTLPDNVFIRGSGITGYGEKLVGAAFGVDVGEVETVAHARAAEFVQPGVDFVIDIGGQDMKCLGVKNGVVNRVFLNEACSSGCGSFLQSFAESLGMTVPEFAAAAEKSAMPVDLGTRCTVFMNSRVRQAQKEGASIPDISAGLAYSVVRNALYKVLKIRSADELGNRIVVQGGTFKNDALLRAFELTTEREVVRPGVPELMGAFGVALIARDRWSANRPVGPESSLVAPEALRAFAFETSTSRCGGCGNRCLLTRTRFDDGRSYVGGNRCERGAPTSSRASLPPNLYARKYERLFGHYEPLEPERAFRGTLGLPRVLNMYENYPFWFTLFTTLGFRVELSSTRPEESLGIDTVPSQTVCYPAKLAHRHLLDLIGRGVTRIFYPGVPKERIESEGTHNHFNCPVLAGYPDVVRLNIDELREPGVEFVAPFLPLDSPRAMLKHLPEALAAFRDVRIGKREIKRALDAAYAEQSRFKRDIRAYGDEVLEFLKREGGIGIVLAGHPYHLDPEVHHGIPELVNGYGVAVLTEDSICDRDEGHEATKGLYVVDQWVYHSRLYRAAAVVARHPELQMVQLNSFGCGLDAISADQAASLLERHGKLHTLIKIDEGKNNGAVQIRIRSLLAAVRHASAPTPPVHGDRTGPRGGTSRSVRTLLCPPLSPHHFQFLQNAVEGTETGEGRFDFVVLPEGSREAIELGLKYVNNDACYPAMVVVGQFLHAFRSGAYDPNTTDCFYAQTGGACRASNYVPLLRRALDAAGYSQVRIWALNAQEDGQAERFRMSRRTLWRTLLALLYGDLIMRLILRTRPYEIVRGSADALYREWTARCQDNVREGSWKKFKTQVREMVQAFSSLAVNLKPKPRVGIVGEILVKFHAGANERLVELIEREGGEAVVPDLSSFLLYCFYDSVYARRKLSGKLLPGVLGKAGLFMMERLVVPLKNALAGTRFGDIHDFEELVEQAESTVSIANQAGEGWLLTAEMISLLESGVNNVLCIQPFACLPNHVTGKGVIRELRRRFQGANILALDYDASVSTVNQLNRIKLLMAGAGRQNL